jgi:hypothetical protein
VKANNLWPIVTLACVVLVCVTVALALHVEIATLLGVVNVVALPIIGLILYNQGQAVKENTDGNFSGMIDYLKAQKTAAPAEVTVVPVNVIPPKTGS